LQKTNLVLYKSLNKPDLPQTSLMSNNWTNSFTSPYSKGGYCVHVYLPWMVLSATCGSNVFISRFFEYL